MIEDLYSYILEEIQVYIKDESKMKGSLVEVVCA
jgi:hypothetical protein